MHANFSFREINPTPRRTSILNCILHAPSVQQYLFIAHYAHEPDSYIALSKVEIKVRNIPYCDISRA